jgi:tetratricopeptide (TPR) repeat protein
MRYLNQFHLADCDITLNDETGMKNLPLLSFAFGGLFLFFFGWQPLLAATQLELNAACDKAIAENVAAKPCLDALLAAESDVEKNIKGSAAHIKALENIGQVFADENNWKKAEQIYLKLYQLKRTALGLDNVELTKTLNSLATMQINLRQYADAEKSLKLSLSILEKVKGESLELANAHNALGLLYARAGNFNEAEKAFYKAVVLKAKILGETHVDVATLLNNLGYVRKSIGKIKEAELNFKKALEIIEKTSGKDSYLLADPLMNWCSVLVDKKDFLQAEIQIKRLLALQLKKHGQESLQVADAVNRLAVNYYKSKMLDKAEMEFRSALNIREKKLGLNHLLTAEISANLGALLMQQGRHADAFPYLRHSAAVTHVLTGAGSELSQVRWNLLDQLFVDAIAKKNMRPN